MIKEIYSVDLDSALTKTNAESLSNDLLFQKDKNDIDTTRDYWYFNGRLHHQPGLRPPGADGKGPRGLL